MKNERKLQKRRNSEVNDSDNDVAVGICEGRVRQSSGKGVQSNV